MGKVGFLLLLAVWGSTVLAGTPLNVYQTCVTPDGVRGTCRQQQAVLAGPSDVKAGAVLELPVDMRLPCTDAKRGCAEVCARPSTCEVGNKRGRGELG